MSRQRARRGMTLVGVLVAIAIIGVLAALLLPAVQQAREAARRNQCMHKIKLLALALQNCHDAQKKFPATSNQGNDGGVASVWWPAPGGGATTGAIPSAGYTMEAGSPAATAGYSWIVMALPYLDEAQFYNAIAHASGKFRADAFTPFDAAGVKEGKGTGRTFCLTTANGRSSIARHFAAVSLDELICPSYAGSRTVASSTYTGSEQQTVRVGNPPAAYGFPEGNADLGSPPQRAAITNYVALAATHFPLMRYAAEANSAATTDIPKDGETPNGMIVPGSGLNMKECTDGASRTIMLCETIEPAMNCWYDGTTTWTTGINPNTVESYPPSNRYSSTNNPSGFWKQPDGGTTALQVGPAPLATTAYSPALAGYCATPQVISWGPSSNHSGGVVVHAFVDGSVHIVTSDIDTTYYMQIITRAGREPEALPDSIQ